MKSHETPTTVDVRDEPLSIDAAFAGVQGSRAGAVCIFIGTVREVDEGREVTALRYESHPIAVRRMREIVDDVTDEVDVIAVHAVHRIGDLAIGDLAVVVAVSAGHRGEAFEAGRRIIDALKDQVPIWKLQTFTAGDAEWVNSP